MSTGPATGCPDLTAIRSSIPALARDVHGKPLVYLDAAATIVRPWEEAPQGTNANTLAGAKFSSGVLPPEMFSVLRGDGEAGLSTAFARARRLDRVRCFVRGEHPAQLFGRDPWRCGRLGDGLGVLHRPPGRSQDGEKASSC